MPKELQRTFEQKQAVFLIVIDRQRGCQDKVLGILADYMCGAKKQALKRGVVEQSDVGVNGFANFHRADVFVGSMASRRVARTHLQRGEGHESLVGQRGRAKRHFAHGEESLHQRMVGADARWVEPRAARRECAGWCRLTD